MTKAKQTLAYWKDGTQVIHSERREKKAIYSLLMDVHGFKS